MGDLYIYNTQTRQKEKFVPITSGKVGIYVCGVTVYDDVHLGHARSIVAFDAIVRYLRQKGYDVSHVTNFTDVDDKIIKRAADLSVEPLKLSKMYIDKFSDDMKYLRVKPADQYPKASEMIADIIKLVEKLVDKGFAYESGGDVFFDITKAKDYGRLSGISSDQVQAGARIEVDEKKRNPADFALWKAAKEGEISWQSPWGPGRPGWHIECSAMALKFLGDTLDIHGGGSDLLFPHHENEIQQSEASTGKKFVNYWMHNGMLMVNKEKMSKSLKNFFTIKDICKKYDGSTVRFFLLNTHYRQPIEYDVDSLDEAKKSLERLQNAYDELNSARDRADGSDDAKTLTENAIKNFEKSMDDDLNTREGLATMFSLSRDANRLLAEKKLSRAGVENIISTMDRFDSVFDIMKSTGGGQDELLSQLMAMVLDVRERARQKKDFATADSIRDGLAKLGIEIQDSAEGPKWKIKR